MMAMAPRAPALAGRVQALAEAWEAAASAPLWHPPTCACGAGMAMVLSFAAAEADLADYLAAEARQESDEPALAAIATLQAAQGRSLAEWLRTLCAYDLPSSSLERLLGRIETFIDSVRAPAGGSRFTCT